VWPCPESFEVGSQACAVGFLTSPDRPSFQFRTQQGGAALFQAVVWVGESQPAQAVDQSGADVEGALRKPTDVSAASDHGRGDGGIKLEDSDDQIQRPGLPQLRELPDSDPVLLRQAQHLPIMKPEEGKKQAVEHWLRSG